MKLILMAEKERLAILTVPDNTQLPEVIKYGYGCIDCMKVHLAQFNHVGLHDDGEIFELGEIHQ